MVQTVKFAKNNLEFYIFVSIDLIKELKLLKL